MTGGVGALFETGWHMEVTLEHRSEGNEEMSFIGSG